MVAGKVDVTVVTNTEVAKLGSYPDIIDLVNVPKVVPEIPYEFGMPGGNPVAEINVGESVFASPIFANGTLYVAGKSRLYAIGEGR